MEHKKLKALSMAALYCSNLAQEFFEKKKTCIGR